MQVFDSIINQGNSIMYGFLLLTVFGVASVFFLITLKGAQFRYFLHSIKLITEKHDGGGMSGFSGYIVSTASRVGTGSMTGIVIAITTGGPGALFWMWVMVFMGAALAIAESSLAQLYKEKDSKGNYVGGASYYIKSKLKNNFLGIIFAILLVTCYSIFNGVQSNTISSALANYGVNVKYTAIALAIITAAILLSPKRETLTNACSFIVPVMGLPYILSGVIVFFMNIGLVPEAIQRVVSEAFTPQAFVAGGIGTTIATGLARGLFSNEAGMGGAPHAAAATSVSHPVKQGLLQMLSCYTTTLVVCSITAILVLLSPEAMAKTEEIKGIQLLQYAMSTHFGSVGAMFITFCAVLFAYSSVLGNFFYIRTGAASIKESNVSYFVVAIITLILCFFGSIAPLPSIWNMGDFTQGVMALLNIIVVCILWKPASLLISDYTKQLKEGKNPKFTKSSIKELANDDAITQWNEESK